MKRFFLIFLAVISISFWLGKNFGRHVSGIERENLYPLELRDIWVKHQPTCVDYALLSSGKRKFLIDTINDDAGQMYVKTASPAPNRQDGKLIFPILNAGQERFIDELWLECGQQDSHQPKP